MAQVHLRDILPLASGLMATAVLSFALGGLTTVWLLHGQPGAGGGKVAAALPMPERAASLFDPDAIERDSAPLAVVRWTGGDDREPAGVQQEARKPAGDTL